jgi:hypothetical protein
LFLAQVHMVRSLRHELAMLQTDHKQVRQPLPYREPPASSLTP